MTLKHHVLRILDWIRSKTVPTPAERYLAERKKKLRDGHKLDMRYNPLAMDEDISGPWDRDPDWFKKNPDFLRDNPDFFFPKDRGDGT